MATVYRDIENVEVEFYGDSKIVDNGVEPTHHEWCMEVEEVTFEDNNYSEDFKQKLWAYIEANEGELKQELEEDAINNNY